MRSDGLSTVLASLLADRRVVAATLVDVGSGFLLDACTRDDDLADLELLGAAHADLARAGSVLAPSGDGGGGLVVETADGRVHVLREVPDPHGDRIVLAAVVRGSARVVARVRQRLADVPVEALTAGPTLQRRPVDGRWDLGPVVPIAPAVPPEGLPGLDPVPTTGDGVAWAPRAEPAPWATAMTPVHTERSEAERPEAEWPEAEWSEAERTEAGRTEERADRDADTDPSSGTTAEVSTHP